MRDRGDEGHGAAESEREGDHCVLSAAEIRFEETSTITMTFLILQFNFYPLILH